MGKKPSLAGLRALTFSLWL